VDFTAAVAVAVQAYFDAVYVCIAFNVLSIMTLTPAIVIFCIFRSGIQYFALLLFFFPLTRLLFVTKYGTCYSITSNLQL